MSFLPHLLLSVPSAGEPTQGYLHGGLLLDFIGQRNLPLPQRTQSNCRWADESMATVGGGFDYSGTAVDDVGCDG